MSNHYHLALETPKGNLVEGMRWLQGTLGNRFNKFTGERGHVFQGRYKRNLAGPQIRDWLSNFYRGINPLLLSGTP